MEKLNIRRAVVTGCTGAVGTALVKELTKRGAEVLALCRKSSERTSRLAGLENVKVEDCPLERLKELTNGGGEPFDAFSIWLGRGRRGKRGTTFACKATISVILWTPRTRPRDSAARYSWGRGRRRNTVRRAFLSGPIRRLFRKAVTEWQSSVRGSSPVWRAEGKESGTFGREF